MVDQVFVPSSLNPRVLTNPLKEKWAEVIRSRGRAYLQVALLFYISNFLHFGLQGDHPSWLPVLGGGWGAGEHRLDPGHPHHHLPVLCGNVLPHQ